MIVVDADVIAYFWFEQESERSHLARRARRIDPHWSAPSLWRSEFRSILWSYMNAGHLTMGQALRFADKAEKDMDGNEFDVATADVLKLVEVSGHSSYDCEYVALASSLGVSLVTGDGKLRKLFPDVAVLLEDFAG